MKNSELNNIGLKITDSKQIAEKLNDLLANYQQFYMNLRGFHWNIKGKKFFELHLKFEELYNDALEKVDEIAERILTLSQSPYHTFTKYLKHSEINEAENVSDGESAVENILKALEILLSKERSILKAAAGADDEGTVALMSEYIVEQEKLVWMFSAYKN
ncbi:Dps family protein [Zobellia galactanivorans]|uniref:DNA protection during starvation protein n=1 Tax=Zobellia galactanivorans (strain DSM 12802 / CCUG 47099 / CIP 106680 / NCIMB 13871 / Dsij) TaxID=63186 RepID=G0L407_ZOBGA|nr:Dps family protein [Zobellia galactanivorans]CAZ98562.1 DNA protection during starvation protein [Zobellia galactanivorans]